MWFPTVSVSTQYSDHVWWKGKVRDMVDVHISSFVLELNVFSTTL